MIEDEEDASEALEAFEAAAVGKDDFAVSAALEPASDVPLEATTDAGGLAELPGALEAGA